MHLTLSLPVQAGRGKSGQRRASCHLTNGLHGIAPGRQKVSQKLYRLIFGVRVKSCGKSARFVLVTGRRDKPHELQCHVYPDPVSTG